MELHVNENRASTWAIAAKLPQGFAQVRDYDTFLIY